LSCCELSCGNLTHAVFYFDPGLIQALSTQSSDRAGGSPCDRQDINFAADCTGSDSELCAVGTGGVHSDPEEGARLGLAQTGHSVDTRTM
jgi:hypothetical protein